MTTFWCEEVHVDHDNPPTRDLRLVPFRRDWAAAVAAWATSADEALAWCSAAVPVPAATVAAWGDDDDVDPYALLDGDDLVAYGEVWSDHEEAETELARIIVSPARRGSGVGRALTRHLAAHARAVYADVVLRVRPGNESAERCYAAAGFVRMRPQDEQQFNVGQPVEYVWMQLPSREAGRPAAVAGNG